MKQLFLILVIALGCSPIFSQEDKGFFLVEFDAFSPPVQDMVRHFEGRQAESFMVNDIAGNSHLLSAYQGKKMILWYWSMESPLCQSQIGQLELLQERNPDLKLITFASEQKKDLLDYKEKTDLKLTVIPNADVFGEMAYGADLGKPRIFVVDSKGIIRKVLPEQSFGEKSKLLHGLETILKDIE